MSLYILEKMMKECLVIMVKELSSHGLCVNDSDAKTLFILESPFDSELMENCGCVGKTGKNMTKVLGLSSNDALGKMLNDGDLIAKKYAIFNTFKFPLDIAVAVKMIEAGKNFDLWDEFKIPWSILKKDEGKKIETLKKEINAINGNISCKKYYSGYKRSLMSFLRKCPNLSNIVVCGKIAQAMFESILEGEQSFKELEFQCGLIGNKEYNVMYTVHPSLWYSPKKGYGAMVKKALNRL